jgi:hypothetical protein
MKIKHLYLLLALLGLILPYTQFVSWLTEYGFDPLLLSQQVASSPAAAFGWLDVLVSAVVLLVFIAHETRQQRVPHLWLPILGTFVVGVSFGLPLYLYLREIARG